MHRLGDNQSIEQGKEKYARKGYTIASSECKHHHMPSDNPMPCISTSDDKRNDFHITSTQNNILNDFPNVTLNSQDGEFYNLH